MSKTPLSIDPTKRFILPAFNKSPRNQLRQANLATNLATAGLFSALAACGGDEVSAITFNTFTQVAPFLADVRHVDANSRTTAIYIKTGISVATDTNDNDLGTLSASVQGGGSISYSIIGADGYRFGSGKTVNDYFAINSNGTLELKADQTLDVSNSTDNRFTVTVKASSGGESNTHVITFHLGLHHAADAAGGSFTSQAGDDYLEGSTGTDTLSGGSGDDYIKGGAGNDQLNGNAGSDTLYGGDDDDELNGGDGADTLYGGAGINILNGDAGNDFLYGGVGVDTLNGGADNDVLMANASNDFLNGNAGDDQMHGGAGTDTLDGGSGNDFVDGGAGNDHLNGGTGADELYGGEGNDELTGGTGADDFIMSGATVVANGSDIIKDFSRIEGDKIHFQVLAANALSFADLAKDNSGADVVVSGYGASGQMTFEGWGGTANPDKILIASDFEFIV